MRDELFAFFVDVGHNLCYLRAYSISARRISNVFSGFLLITSAGGIATLSCWNRYPVIWALIVFVAQILQALKPLMQAARQRAALKYMIQDCGVIFDEVCTYWNTVGAYSPPLEDDSQIAAKIDDFKRRMQDSKNRFAADLDFPFKKRLDKLAKVENSKFFWYHYKVEIEEEYLCQVNQSSQSPLSHLRDLAGR